jgi:5-methylthioadenosine/S-adenosylhomocysteine deaminase
MVDLLVRNAVVIGLDVGLSRTDIAVQDGVISALIPAGTAPVAAARVIDAGGGVLFPGMVNGHLHSNEFLMKGRVSGQPLEPYILKTWARVADDRLPSPDVVYASTMLNCSDLLRGGVTSVIDDFTPIRYRDEYVDAAMSAYVDSGMRADCSIAIMDRPATQHIPGIEHLVPGDFSGAESQPPAAQLPDAQRSIAFVERQLQRWPSTGRVRAIISPSAPQRCTPQTLIALHQLSATYGVPLHIHVQESRIQATSGRPMYGMSMLMYLHRLGVLDSRTTIAHGIWLDERDMAVAAAAGASVIHNPASNLKLGSGIAAVARMLSAGINVGLGTDANTCNDSQNMLEAMKLAALLSCVARADPQAWLRPQDVLAMATTNGAQAAGWEGVGAIRVGAHADLVLARPDSLAFIPLNNAASQLVYAASPADVRTVIAAGRVVVDEGQVTTVDIPAYRDTVQAAAADFWDAARGSLLANQALAPAFAHAYSRATQLIPDDASAYGLLARSQYARTGGGAS